MDLLMEAARKRAWRGMDEFLSVHVSGLDREDMFRALAHAAFISFVLVWGLCFRVGLSAPRLLLAFQTGLYAAAAVLLTAAYVMLLY
jgi:hypothetical protein